MVHVTSDWSCRSASFGILLCWHFLLLTSNQTTAGRQLADRKKTKKKKEFGSEKSIFVSKVSKYIRVVGSIDFQTRFRYCAMAVQNLAVKLCGILQAESAEGKLMLFKLLVK